MSKFPWANTSEDIAEQTQSQWETPLGSQEKADQAETNAKEYADDQLNEHIHSSNAHPEAVPNGNSGFISGTDLAKVKNISPNAKKTAASSTNGNIRIDDVETNVYTHPATHPASMIVESEERQFSTGAERDKLSNISPNAEVNQNAFSKVSVTGQPDISAGSKTDTIIFRGGTGITTTTNAATKTVTITATGDATPGAHAETHITGGTDVIPNAVYGGDAGLMSGADKKAQDDHIANANIHVTLTNKSDWNAKETTTGAQNKVNTHAADNNIHVTALKQTAWDAKETPTGAQNKVDAHANLKNNPHTVTTAQIGAETPIGAQSKVDAHANLKNNPHSVTVSQIGAETPAGAQAKASQAETNANNYTNSYTIKTRINNGVLEYWTGTEWRTVGDFPIGYLRTSAGSGGAHMTWTTITNISGVPGRIDSARVNGVGTIGIRVTIDGAVDTVYASSPDRDALNNFWYLRDTDGPIYFYNSFKMEVYSNDYDSDDDIWNTAYGEAKYRLKAGTP